MTSHSKYVAGKKATMILVYLNWTGFTTESSENWIADTSTESHTETTTATHHRFFITEYHNGITPPHPTAPHQLKSIPQ